MLIIVMASTRTKPRNEEALETFFMNGWSFWFCLIKWVHEDRHATPKESVEYATSRHHSFKELNVDLRQNAKWLKPPQAILKLNVDEAIYFNNNNAGIGAILKNHMGDIVFAASMEKQNF